MKNYHYILLFDVISTIHLITSRAAYNFSLQTSLRLLIQTMSSTIFEIIREEINI